MALLTLTFPPGTCAAISKSGPTWTVDSVNTVAVTIVVDDTDNDGTVSNDEWDAAIGGGGNDTGDVAYLFEGGGASGQLYSTDGATTFTVGQNVTAIKSGLSNSFEADVSGVVCLTRGTRILTATGQVRIEEISLGDEIVVDGHKREPLRWIGRRRYTAQQLEQNPKLRPVRVMAGALGNGLPKRDLLVSRQHRMLVQSKIAHRMFGTGEVLVSAIKLTDLPGIFVDETVEEVEYFHLLFDRHEIIYAESAPTESLFTGPEALKSLSREAREEILTIFPEVAELDYAPEPAHCIPSGKLQKQLIARHVKNNKPVLGGAFRLSAE